jgi:hypothetical protein
MVISKKAEQILEAIEERIEKPFVTAKFGDNWREHYRKMLVEGQITTDMLLDIAWKQGRRALLMEDAIKRFVKD